MTEHLPPMFEPLEEDVPPNSRQQSASAFGLRRLVGVAVTALVLALNSAAITSPAFGAVDYLKDIQPLVRSHCSACHGALKQKADLRLDTAQWMLKGGKNGPVLTPGTSSNSAIIARISTSDLAERMPPEHEGEPFSSAQIQLLRIWIDEGAHAPANEAPEQDPKDHWAFRPRVQPTPPTVQHPEWLRNPIDAFIAAPREKAGLSPQPEAPRATLVRRLYLDLIGLPPSPANLAASESDHSPDWYEQIVDRLLEDPRHGERWARHWMDIWRYSDWWGFGDQLRNSQKHIWHWRDWIIESLNTNILYDELIRQMLAADELYPEDLQKLRATGYLARNYFLFNRNQWLEETVEHVSKGFMGLTLNCAKCHDHKFDPLTQEDFYKLRAFFEPYHARIDVLPSQPDLARDGLPRAYDAHPETPTYRFIRGQENSPDKTKLIEPGIPKLLAFKSLNIQPVALPRSAAQPSRRSWVFDAYRAQAKETLVGQTLAATATSNRLVQLRSSESSSPLLEETRLNLVANLAAVDVARHQLESVEARASAMLARWAREDAGTSTNVDHSLLAQQELSAREAAIRSERSVARAKAQQSLTDVELRLQRSAVDKREAVAKDVQSTREALTKADQKLAEPIREPDNFTPLIGTAWTPTRFFDSTKDDPTPVLHPTSTGRRKALAEWITDSQHPLTARVAVNHLWNRHFGTPLAPAVFDFGRKAGTPIHTELIDWLACDLVDSGWNLKQLHKRILLSATYRMDSSQATTGANQTRDPDNQLWWYRPAIRLEAETVRDSILYLSEALDLQHGGPSIPASDQAASKRRSLYFYHSNNDRNLFLTTFDAANVKECYRRDQTIVPHQALALANSELTLSASERISSRIEQSLPRPDSSPSDDSGFIRLAFKTVLGLNASKAEITACIKSLQAWRTLPENKPSSAAQPELARAHLVWALLNHTDFVTLR